jgi:hypothetical protein
MLVTLVKFDVNVDFNFELPIAFTGYGINMQLHDRLCKYYFRMSPVVNFTNKYDPCAKMPAQSKWHK